MPTINQLVRKGRKKTGKKSSAPALTGSPQRRGVCVRVFTTTPKKPNSAMRKCVRVQLVKNGKQVSAFLPGDGASKLVDEHDEVVIECIGGKIDRAKGNLPGIRWQVLKINDQAISSLLSGALSPDRLFLRVLTFSSPRISSFRN